MSKRERGVVRCGDGGGVGATFSSVAPSIAASESESEWSCSCGGGQRKVRLGAREGPAQERRYAAKGPRARSISAEVRVKESGKGGVGI